VNTAGNAIVLMGKFVAKLFVPVTGKVAKVP
jgi:hypothetical protein